MNGEMGSALSSGRHDLGRALKDQGKKLLGYLCAYCPEEIVYAAGLVPVRIFGGGGPFPLAGSYLPDYYCAHARGCLNAGLAGEYDYLDGILLPYACLHTQGAYDSWARQAKGKYTRFIDMPSLVDTAEALAFFAEELEAFKKSLEDAFGVSITEGKLQEAIRLCNRNREFLREIYMRKREDRPLISGAEVFSLILANMVGPKDEQGLTRLIADLSSRHVPGHRPARVMVLGTELDDPRIFSAVESQGAIVVADNLCTGSRYIWQDVELSGDPTEAIARRYLLGVNCPLKRPAERGLRLVEELMETFRVEKALFMWPQACDPMGWAVPVMKGMLDKRGIPYRWVTMRGDGSEEDISAVTKVAAELVGG